MIENRRTRSQGFGIQNNGMYRVFSKYKFMGLCIIGVVEVVKRGVERYAGLFQIP